MAILVTLMRLAALVWIGVVVFGLLERPRPEDVDWRSPLMRRWKR